MNTTPRTFEVHIYGEVPQCLEIPALTPEQAVLNALQDVIDRLDFKAYPQGSEEAAKAGGCRQVEVPPPEAKKRRSAGRKETP